MRSTSTKKRRKIQMEMKGPELSMSLTESYSRVRRGLTEESKLRTVGSGRAWKVEEEAD